MYKLENFLSFTDDPALWQSVTKDKWSYKVHELNKYFILMRPEKAGNMDRSDWGNIKFLFNECIKEQKIMQEFFSNFQHFTAEIESLQSFPLSSACNIRGFIQEFLRFESRLHRISHSYLGKAKSFIDLNPSEFIPETLIKSDENGIFCKKERLRYKKPKRILELIRRKTIDYFSYIAVETGSRDKDVVTVEYGLEPFKRCGIGYRELWFRRKGKWVQVYSQQIWIS